MRTIRTIVAASLALMLCLSACRQKDKIIPRATMADIYVDLFLADQWLMNQRGDDYTAADTVRFYEPIFRKYGYTTLDFRNSANYYLQDARRFARILQRASSQLEERGKYLQRISDDQMARQHEIDQLMSQTHYPAVFYDADFFEQAVGYRITMEQNEWGAWMPAEP